MPEKEMRDAKALTMKDGKPATQGVSQHVALRYSGSEGANLTPLTSKFANRLDSP